MSNKIASKGTKLQLSIATVFTTIAAAMSIKGPGAKPEVMDTTALDSAAGREKKPNGYSDGGVVTATLFLDPQDTTHKTLSEKCGLPPAVPDSWKIIWSDAAPTTWPFSGTLTGFDPGADVGNPLKADIEITLDGTVTYP